MFQIFEKWRVVDTEILTSDKREEYEADLQESNRRYDQAFNAVLSHTSKVELESFWGSFGSPDATCLSGLNLYLSNPLHDQANGMSSSKSQPAEDKLGTGWKVGKLSHQPSSTASLQLQGDAHSNDADSSFSSIEHQVI